MKTPKPTQKSFASGLNFYKLVWIFIIGSVFGYILETVWFFLVSGHYMCRQGVVFGPFSQIYGFGALLITIVLYRVRNKSSIIIFICSGFLGAAFEYLCSYFQEMIVGTVSWDYSDQPFNLHGRTSLSFVLVWGLLGLIFIKHTYPFLSNLIEKIPNTVGRILTIFLAIFLAIDMLISGLALFRQAQRRENIPSTNFITDWLDAWFPDSVLDSIYTGVTVVVDDTEPSSPSPAVSASPNSSPPAVEETPSPTES